MSVSRAPLTFFVPGILGSSLRDQGVGEFGEPIDEEIWGEDVKNNIDLLGTSPARLTSSNLLPGIVIRKMGGHDVYGKIIEYCISRKGLGLKENETFFEFPYNWTRDNLESANQLADRIENIDATGQRPLRFIAHSMGGVVVRLLLHHHNSIEERTDLIFQIASPVQGSAKTFYTLKRHPKFNPLFDMVWKVLHHLQPDRRADLQATLNKFSSLYQLLPPSEIKVALDRKGAQYSAVDPQVWSKQTRSQLKDAVKVQDLLATSLKCKVCCVYSNQQPTEILYWVDKRFKIVGRKTVSAAGDGTVTCESAVRGSPIKSRRLIATRGADHMNLCSHKAVLALLSECLLCKEIRCVN